MATFSVIPREQAKRLVMGRRSAERAEYQEYMRSLQPGEAGRLELEEGGCTKFRWQLEARALVRPRGPQHRPGALGGGRRARASTGAKPRPSPAWGARPDERGA
jgi:hypothetical protein